MSFSRALREKWRQMFRVQTGTGVIGEVGTPRPVSGVRYIIERFKSPFNITIYVYFNGIPLHVSILSECIHCHVVNVEAHRRDTPGGRM